MSEETIKTGNTGSAGSLGFAVPPDDGDEEANKNQPVIPAYQKGQAVLWVSKNVKARVQSVRVVDGHATYVIKTFDAGGRPSGVALCTTDELAQLKALGVKHSTKTLAGAAVWVRSLADMLRIDHQVTSAEIFKGITYLRDAMRNREANLLKMPFVQQAMMNLQSAYQMLKKNPRADVRRKVSAAAVALDTVKPSAVGNARSLQRQFKTWKLMLLADYLAEAQDLPEADWPEVVSQVKNDLTGIYGEPDATKTAGEDAILRGHIKAAAEAGDNTAQVIESLASARAEVLSILDVGGMPYDTDFDEEE